MSFGLSAGDVATIVQLAWTTLQNCKKACGEYDELTQQVASLWGVLRELKKENRDTKSLLHHQGKSHWDDLRPSLDGAQDVLRSLNSVVSRYAQINRRDRGLGRFWTRAKFGNKELGTLNDLRQKARFYVGAISAVLNTVTVGSLGRIEDLLRKAGLENLRPAIEDVAGKVAALHNQEGTVLTYYSQDDTAVWKELRRELVKAKIGPSDIIGKNKELIMKFVHQLGDQGALDMPVEETGSIGDLRNEDRQVRNKTHRPDPVGRGPEYSASQWWKTFSTSVGNDSEPSESDSIEPGLSCNNTHSRGARARDKRRRLHGQIGTAVQDNRPERSDQDFQPDTSPPGKASRPEIQKSIDPLQYSRIAKNHAKAQPRQVRGSNAHVQEEEEEEEEKNISEFDKFYLSTEADSYSEYESVPEIVEGNGNVEVITKSSKTNASADSPSNKEIQSSGLELTSKNLFEMEIRHFMPAMLNSLPIDQPPETFWTCDDVERGIYMYFLATPWGICLCAGTHNLSLSIEYLKFVTTAIDECLEKAGLEGALKNGEPGFDAQSSALPLQEALQHFSRTVRRELRQWAFEELAEQLPPEPHKSEIEAFGNQFLRQAYDRWRFVPKKNTWDNVVFQNGAILLLEILISIQSLMKSFSKESGEMNRSALPVSRWPRGQRAGESWEHDPSSSHSPQPPLGFRSDTEKDPHIESSLRTIEKRLTNFVEQAEKLSQDSSLDKSAGFKENIYLRECATRDVLLELDNLAVGTDIVLRTRRKVAVDRVQTLLNDLESRMRLNSL